MTGLSRRELIGGVAVSGFVVSAASAAETEQPPYGPAPPPLAGAELPSFRFPLGAQPTQQFNGGTAKEAKVEQFPVSEKLAGVYMTLEPGALRELHWHANAAEWAYVLDGQLPRHHHRSQQPMRDRGFRAWRRVVFPARDMGIRSKVSGRALAPSSSCSTTAISPSSAPSRSATGWDIRRRRCSRAISACRPRRSRIFRRRKSISRQDRCPRPCRPTPHRARATRRALTHRYQLHAAKPEQFAGGTMRTVSEREFPISTTMTGAMLAIKPGGLRELHWHPNAAEWQFYVKGSARMTVFGCHGRARTDEFARRRCRLCAARLWPLHREHRQRGHGDRARAQQRHL